MTETRLVHEYSSLTGLVVREETEADRALFAALKEAAERRASEPFRGWSILLSKEGYEAAKRILQRREPPRPGYRIMFGSASGPYHAGKPS